MFSVLKGFLPDLFDIWPKTCVHLGEMQNDQFILYDDCCFSDGVLGKNPMADTIPTRERYRSATNGQNIVDAPLVRMAHRLVFRLLEFCFSIVWVNRHANHPRHVCLLAPPPYPLWRFSASTGVRDLSRW